jgi:hypothetical protein
MMEDRSFAQGAFHGTEGSLNPRQRKISPPDLFGAQVVAAAFEQVTTIEGVGAVKTEDHGGNDGWKAFRKLRTHRFGLLLDRVLHFLLLKRADDATVTPLTMGQWILDQSSISHFVVA